MSEFQISGTPGGMHSAGTELALGYVDPTIVIVTWIGVTSKTDNTREIEFGPDDGGFPVTLARNTPTPLTMAQALQAQRMGAQLVIMESSVLGS